MNLPVFKCSRNFPGKELTEWFRREGRKFPWRETRNAYKVLVAEKLLQQTRVTNIVVTAYKAVLKRYPNITSLSTARLASLQTILSALGLIYRSKELKLMAKQILTDFNGKIPKKYVDLIGIRGIGPYIAKAVLCFAYRKSVGLVDTNIARILYRYFGLEGTLPANPVRNKLLNELAEEIIQTGNARTINLALIDLGALLCLPRNPNCAVCPLNQNCHYGIRYLKSVGV